MRILRNGFICALLLVVGTSFSSCKSCSKEQSKKNAAVQKKLEVEELKTTLLSRIPKASVGFMRWQGNHPAYERLLKSPWGKSDAISSFAAQSNPQVNEMSEVLKKVGLDPSLPETWKSVFSEAVFFVVPDETAESSREMALGMVFRSDKKDLSAKFRELRSELDKTEPKTKEIAVEGGFGFEFVSKGELKTTHSQQPVQGQTYYVAFVQNTGVISTAQWVIERVGKSSSEALPTLAETERFNRAVGELSSTEDERYALGYVDLEMLFGKALQTEAGAQPRPEKAFVVASSMKESPESEARILFDPDTAKGSWLESLGSSSSKVIVSALPENVLLSITLDGLLLKGLRGVAAAASAGQAAADQFAFIESASRMGLVAKVAPLGQAVLPFPDLMILFETSDAAGVMQALENSISQAMGSSAGMAQLQQGGPAMSWAEKKLPGDVTLKSMMHPLGIGAFLAAKDNLVFLATTEKQIRDALDEKQHGAFSKSVSSRSQKVLLEEENIATVFVDFFELSKMMVNLGGVLSMFAPQMSGGSGTQEMLDPKNIESLKQMGRLVCSLTQERDSFVMRSFYEPSKGVESQK